MALAFICTKPVGARPVQVALARAAVADASPVPPTARPANVADARAAVAVPLTTS